MSASTERPTRTGSGRITPGLVTTLLLIAACTIPNRGNATDMPPVPDAPCTLAERMNIQVVDGWMYECRCSVLAHGFHCEWDLVGLVEPVALRKRIKAKKHARHHVVVRYALPTVTA